ncbi:sugar transferase, partial [Patescibacteria group bacterium]|nr:sugar transferase [Patescibacteria group bacterium]
GPNGSAESNGIRRTIKGDKRITRFGKILRFTKLDELPQLWNVFMGNMSIVGPRPERPEEFEELISQLPFNDLRLLVKPGVTGWAQINYKAPTDLDELRVRLAYDLYYIKNRSVVLNLIIALRTAKEFFGQADER